MLYRTLCIDYSPQGEIVQTTGYGNKLRIMLIDDERDITTVLKIGLEHAGYAVDIFNNPAQALSSFKPRQYDIIVTDIKMPGMTGFELAREIMKIQPDTKICLMSSFEIYEQEARKVFPTLKNYCFIKKPIAPSALAKHIQAHFVKQ
jgi:DNA-binding NtrC family response regulator